MQITLDPLYFDSQIINSFTSAIFITENYLLISTNSFLVYEVFLEINNKIKLKRTTIFGRKGRFLKEPPNIYQK